MNNLLQNLLLLQRIGHKCRVFWEGEVFVVWFQFHNWTIKVMRM
jgi:hypothetical protein